MISADVGLLDAFLIHLNRVVWFILASLLLSVLIAYRGRGYWFAMMTTVWAVVNAGIVAVLVMHMRSGFPGPLEAHSYHIKFWMITNLFLDVGYALVAWQLWTFRKSSHRLMWEGFAWAIWLQALGLFILDGWFLLGLS